MMVLVEMMVWMVMMMIPMKSSLMMVLMAMISPLREGISPAEIYLPERSFSLGVFRPAEAEKIYLWSPLVLGFRREYIGERAESEAEQVGHTYPRRGARWARAYGGVGPL